MIKITLYAHSESFFEVMQSKVDALSRALGDQVKFVCKISDQCGVQCDEGDIAPIAFPVRLGAVFDQILGLLVRENDRWRQAEEIDLGLYRLFPRDMRLQNDEKEIVLTEKERDMIMCIYQCEGYMIEKNNLLSSVWGYGDNIETHTLETHIYRLRQKVEIDPSKPVWLVTTENGYKLNVS